MIMSTNISNTMVKQALFKLLNKICTIHKNSLPPNITVDSNEFKIASYIVHHDLNSIQDLISEEMEFSGVEVLISEAIIENKITWLEYLTESISYRGNLIDLIYFQKNIEQALELGLEAAAEFNSFDTIKYVLESISPDFLNEIGVIHKCLFKSIYFQNLDISKYLINFFYTKYNRSILDELMVNVFNNNIQETIKNIMGNENYDIETFTNTFNFLYKFKENLKENETPQFINYDISKFTNKK